MTLWETKTFIRQSEELLSPEEDSALKFWLGMDPESGDLIPNTVGRESFAGPSEETASAAASELFITSAETICLSFFSRFTKRGARTI